MLSFATGCLATNSVHVGPPQPAKPEGCPIALEQVRPEEAAQTYEQVGAVCATVSEDSIYRHGSIRRRIEDQACGLGGEMITIVGTCSVREFSGVEFGVFRRRARAAIP